MSAPGGRAPRFLVDHMLVKLGAYLRILGYDACHRPGPRTHELILQANDEGRVFLTRNGRIEEQYPRPARLLRLRSEDPVEELREVVRALELDTRSRLFSRCVRCNVALEELAEGAELPARVPARVRERHRRFWRCPSCGTVFWRGTHVANTCRKLGLPPP